MEFQMAEFMTCFFYREYISPYSAFKFSCISFPIYCLVTSFGGALNCFGHHKRSATTLKARRPAPNRNVRSKFYLTLI